jgi:hypothetical protein
MYQFRSGLLDLASKVDSIPKKRTARYRNIVAMAPSFINQVRGTSGRVRFPRPVSSVKRQRGGTAQSSMHCPTTTT